MARDRGIRISSSDTALLWHCQPLGRRSRAAPGVRFWVLRRSQGSGDRCRQPDCYNGAVAFPFEGLKTWTVWEINGTHDKHGTSAVFSPGVKYNLTPERFLAIAVPVGLNSRTARLGIVLQIQITLHGGKTR